MAEVTGRTGKGVKTLGFLILVLFGTLFSLQAKALGNFSANRFDVRFIPNPIGMARLFRRNRLTTPRAQRVSMDRTRRRMSMKRAGESTADNELRQGGRLMQQKCGYFHERQQQLGIEQARKQMDQRGWIVNRGISLADIFHS